MNKTIETPDESGDEHMAEAQQPRMQERPQQGRERKDAAPTGGPSMHSKKIDLKSSTALGNLLGELEKDEPDIKQIRTLAAAVPEEWELAKKESAVAAEAYQILIEEFQEASDTWLKAHEKTKTKAHDKVKELQKTMKKNMGSAAKKDEKPKNKFDRFVDGAVRIVTAPLRLLSRITGMK